ncbi:major facilitator superfamily domain-containing protein [Aspergillus pseudoustus]|uniref:Major facilitator superfamily domain-containing protein n=1 Tax=Aspergillus pseudoustus TaxID=1810923 RepID=A0ABR4JBM3_9EURO
MHTKKRPVPKSAADGFTLLIPQPSDSPDDPLNWDAFTKHTILGVVIACSFLPDYGSVTGAVTFSLQAKEYGNTPDIVNHSQSGNQFMVGAGGTVAVILSAYFGRLPVLFWFMVGALATALGQALSHGFMGFFIPRDVNGFFSGIAQGGGLMFIKDLFFHHEQARKINLWQSCVILSPFMGPLLASFMTIQLSWRWPFHIYSMETGLALLGVVVFGRETYYDRRRSQSVNQWRTGRMGNTFAQAMLRSLHILQKPVVVLVLIYYICIFAWLVAINATLPMILTEQYGFGSKQIGFMYFAPVLAAILAYLIGHWLHDLLAHAYTSRNHGRFDPESQLIIVWLAIPFMVSGLVIVGFALGRNYHYMLVALGWAFYTFGVIVNSASVNMYLLNSYPEASPEVGMWINFAPTAGGFIISYFQVQWVSGVGAEVAFGTQAAICLAVFSIVAVLQLFGRRLREVGEELNF